MPNNNLTTVYGGLSLIVAFVLIAGIVAAPLLKHVWSPDVVVAQR